MDINYKFIPEFELEEQKEKQLIVSYSGKLLEVCSARSLVVYLDNDDKPVVLMSESRLTDASDFELTTY